MTEETQPTIAGHCLCGAVTVRTAPPEPHVDACHCGMCRRWGGGAFLSLKLVTDPQIDGAGHIARYASSDWAERGFCRECGTHLFFFFKPSNGYSFTPGLFDDAEKFELVEEIFIDEKPAYYSFAGDAAKKTGAEVIEEAKAAGFSFD
ncbi:GFA family protein [Parasphingopyxis marina]|uniref:GFA family protein n=1 Tax=Parasphingopyxis marina TaxID=2761622 RepID=A0A842HWQ9_9SPHN|nr:GFA family protein [Parasphingopyxis marina]MBC2776380.1 GFA family protein [Parasphingopyxis marina]